jgi:hypothetical protein
LERVGTPPPITIWDRILHIFIGLHHRIYINHYFKLSPYSKEDLKPWLLPVTAGQLSEEIEHETDVLVELVNEYLEKDL